MPQMTDFDRILAKAGKITGQECIVTVERKITRRLRLNAQSAAAARVEIEAYGDQEAWSDYPCADETDSFRIVSAKMVR